MAHRLKMMKNLKKRNQNVLPRLHLSLSVAVVLTDPVEMRNQTKVPWIVIAKLVTANAQESANVGQQTPNMHGE